MQPVDFFHIEGPAYQTAHDAWNQRRLAPFDTQPDSSSEMQTVHYGVGCDQCGDGPITGLRYKCGNCANYDLCAACYPTVVLTHQQGRHVFIAAHCKIESHTNEALLPALVPDAVIVTRADQEKAFLERYIKTEVRMD